MHNGAPTGHSSAIMARLGVQCRRHRVASAGESRHHAVTLTLLDRPHTAMMPDRLVEEFVVTRDRLRHRSGGALPQQREPSTSVSRNVIVFAGTANADIPLAAPPMTASTSSDYQTTAYQMLSRRTRSAPHPDDAESEAVAPRPIHHLRTLGSACHYQVFLPAFAAEGQRHQHMVGPIRYRHLVLRRDVASGFLLNGHIHRVALGEELV